MQTWMAKKYEFTPTTWSLSRLSEVWLYNRDNYKIVNQRYGTGNRTNRWEQISSIYKGDQVRYEDESFKCGLKTTESRGSLKHKCNPLSVYCLLWLCDMLKEKERNVLKGLFKTFRSSEVRVKKERYMILWSVWQPLVLRRPKKGRWTNILTRRG